MNNADLALVLISVFGLVGMAWGIIASILNHKSVPVSEIDKFLARAYEMAQQTPSQLDDKVVSAAKTAFQGAKDLGIVRLEQVPESDKQEAVG